MQMGRFIAFYRAENIPREQEGSICKFRPKITDHSREKKIAFKPAHIQAREAQQCCKE
jgi:hypothetical protein